MPRSPELQHARGKRGAGIRLSRPLTVLRRRHVAANEGVSAAMRRGIGAIRQLPAIVSKCGKTITHDCLKAGRGRPKGAGKRG
jgi:hypothetical protein